MKTSNDERHLGALMMTIDHRMRRRFREAFAEQGLRRGDWRLLHSLEQAPASLDALQERRTERRRERAERFAARKAAHGLKHSIEQREAEARAEAPGQAEAQPAADEAVQGGRRHGKRPGHGFGRHGFGRRGHGRGFGERPSLEDRLAALQDRGLIELDGEQYRLTAAGQDAHARLKTQVAQLRERTASGISEDEWETTLTTLERIAENLAPAR